MRATKRLLDNMARRFFHLMTNGVMERVLVARRVVSHTEVGHKRIYGPSQELLVCVDESPFKSN